VTSDVTRELDQLYGVPPGEFTAARNAKAAALKAAGRTDDAQTVRRLTKPSPFLWAVNQLARQDPERLTRFIDVVRQGRRSQLHDPRTAAEDMKTIRAALQVLTSRATEILTTAGYRVSPSSSARISNTVLGAATDEDRVDDLRYGRLDAELAAPGFEVLAGAAPARHLQLVRGGKSSEPRRASGESAADRRREQTEAKRERAEARRAQAEAERAREAAEREHRAAELAAARRAADERKAAAERAAGEVRELERRLADARRNLRAAEREAAAAAQRARRHTTS
jgi:hypothetical protein